MRSARYGRRMAGICGIVLAGGAGTRFGGPKALARTADGTPWLARVVAALEEGGCDRVVVALGARAAAARSLVPDRADIVVASDWQDGMSATLRSALAASAGADAVVVATVDVPELPSTAVRRVLAAAGDPPTALAQAVYRGRPGHPAVIGSAHVDALTASLSGDRGARPYLVANRVREVECGGLWSGEDIDTR